MVEGKTESKSNKEEIIVYSTETCPYCVMVKEYLAKKGVEFSDRDVANDQKSAMEMIKKTGQMGVPVLDIGGRLIVGFERKAIDEAIMRLKARVPGQERNMFSDILD